MGVEVELRWARMEEVVEVRGSRRWREDEVDVAGAGGFREEESEMGARVVVEGRRTAIEEDGGEVGGCVACPLTPAVFADGGLWPWIARRVMRFSPGWSSRGTKLMRPDLRRPPSLKEDGPSAAIFFQGGEMVFGLRAEDGCGGGVEARVR